MLADKPLKAFMDGFLVPPTDRYRPVYFKGVGLSKAKEWRETLAANPPLLKVQVDNLTSPGGAYFNALFPFDRNLSRLLHEFDKCSMPLFVPA